jgi:hypothetical protein
VGVSYLIGLLVTFLPDARRHFAEISGRVRADRSPLIPIGAALALIATFAVHLGAFDRAAIEQHSVPFPVPIEYFYGDVRASDAVSNLVLVLAILESLALGIFVLGLRALGPRGSFVAVGVVAAALAGIALGARAEDSPDPYLYVGQALLGAGAYRPPAIAFTGDLATINRVWNLPILPSAYGPLWTGLAGGVIALAPTLAGKLMALRLLGLAAILVCAALAGLLGLPRTVVAAILCNSALYDLFVAGAHNDLAGVDFAIAAMVAVKRQRVLLGIALGVCAALVKITLLPVVAVAVIFLPTFGARVRFVAAVTVVASIAYYLGTHGNGFWALRYVSLAYGAPRPLGATILKTLLGLVALVAIGLAIVRGGVRGRAAWAFSALGVNPLGWYLAWSLPVAIASEDIAYAFLLTLPVAAYVESAVYAETVPFQIVRGIIVFALIAVLAYAYRPNRRR